MFMRFVVTYTNLTFITTIIIITWLVDNDLVLVKFKSINVGVSALKCYTCDGSCFSQTFCNCQTGMCEGQYCFSERYWNGYHNIRKGCGRGNTKMDYGCESEKGKNSTICYCKNGDYCNDEMKLADKATANVTCNLCQSSKHGCSMWCRGDYCWINALNNVKQCGVGSLSLPYHYSNPSLLYYKYASQFDQGTACVNVLAGKTYRVKECICNGNHYCNHRTLPDTSLHAVSSRQQLLTCYSCEGEVHDPSVPPATCKQNTCVGQYCFLLLQTPTVARRNLALQRHAGCVNTTRPSAIVLGCNQRWSLDKWEHLECICNKDFCNQNVNTAYAAISSKQSSLDLSLFLIVFIRFLKTLIV